MFRRASLKKVKKNVKSKKVKKRFKNSRKNFKKGRRNRWRGLNKNKRPRSLVFKAKRVNKVIRKLKVRQILSFCVLLF